MNTDLRSTVVVHVKCTRLTALTRLFLAVTRGIELFFFLLLFKDMFAFFSPRFFLVSLFYFIYKYFFIHLTFTSQSASVFTVLIAVVVVIIIEINFY